MEDIKSVVVCKIPHCGLGNWLFPLMKAKIFAERHQLPLYIIGYNQFKIGPYLRDEKNKRIYRSFFIFQKNALWEIFDRLYLLRYNNYNKIYEPDLVYNNHLKFSRKFLFIISEIPHWSDHFHNLRQFRNLVRNHFFLMLDPLVKNIISKAEVPMIGVHIRMGDFRKLKNGEDFSKVGAVRTPESYFISVIEKLNIIYNEKLTITVFTDGYENEIPLLLNMPNVKLSGQYPDIVDLVLLSKSKVIVTSAGSTFSYWAAFLSNAAVILHPDHIHYRIRNEPQLFEGTISQYLIYNNKLNESTN